MTVTTGTNQTYQMKGNREDLQDMIFNIDPTETPFLSKLDKLKAVATFHEWQTDALAAAAGNAQIEGDAYSATSATPTTRVGNYTQILTKIVSVSGSQEVVNKAGRKSEMAYQIAKKGKELKRDLEKALCGNQAASAGGSNTARTMASSESWLATNRTTVGATDAGIITTGFTTGGAPAPVDGSTAGTFTEVSLKAVLQACWTAGGEPKTVLTGPFNKTRASKFAGIATIYRETKGNSQATVVGAADVYVSDFGSVNIVPSRFNRDKTVQVLDMDYWALATLRPMVAEDMAKVGDSIQKALVMEATLVCRNEKASGKVTDCLTTGTFTSG